MTTQRTPRPTLDEQLEATRLERDWAIEQRDNLQAENDTQRTAIATYLTMLARRDARIDRANEEIASQRATISQLQSQRIDRG